MSAEALWGVYQVTLRGFDHGYVANRERQNDVTIKEGEKIIFGDGDTTLFRFSTDNMHILSQFLFFFPFRQGLDGLVTTKSGSRTTKMF